MNRAAAGPWGHLELTRIGLEPPREVMSHLPPSEAPRWLFSTTDRESVLAALREATLTTEQVALCDRRGRWTSTSTGMSLQPPVEVVFGLLPMARAKLYRTLAGSSDNVHYRNPISISPAVVLAVEAAHLTPQTVEKFHRVLYGTGAWRLLSDLPALLMTCATQPEKMRLMGAILRNESYLIRLVIDGATNIEALVNYWSAHGREETIRPLLESVARLSGESTIDVRGLLPSWQSGRVNRYPRRNDPLEPRTDCFWTAMNFFADQPGPLLQDPRAVLAELKTHFRPVTTVPTFGDVVVLLNEAGSPVHAAVYIADDLVLTKNGAGILRPWAYMKLPEVIELYTSVNGKLQTVYVTEKPGSDAPR